MKTEAIKPSELSEVIIDTTVEPKNVMFPTDARLLNRAREILVRLARKHGVPLRQSYARVGKFALIRHQRYAHAKQFKRANRALKTLRTYLGRVIRDIGRKIEHDGWLRRWCSSPSCCAPGGCAISSSASAGRRSIPCTPRRWSALAKARPIVLTSSASKSPWRDYWKLILIAQHRGLLLDQGLQPGSVVMVLRVDVRLQPRVVAKAATRNSDLPRDLRIKSASSVAV